MVESLTASGLATWSVPACPFLIEYAPRALDDIRLAIVDAFFSLPRGGAEIGGILLGKHENARVCILDYVPLDCEHAFGPSFMLSATDLARLGELLMAASRTGGLEPVGWYHSHTRSEICLTDADLEIHNRYFPEAWQVALVLRPSTFHPMRAGFFFREGNGSIRTAASYQEFTLENSGICPAPPSDGRPLQHAPVNGPSVTMPAATAPPVVAEPHSHETVLSMPAREPVVQMPPQPTAIAEVRNEPSPQPAVEPAPSVPEPLSHAAPVEESRIEVSSPSGAVAEPTVEAPPAAQVVEPAAEMSSPASEPVESTSNAAASEPIAEAPEYAAGTAPPAAEAISQAAAPVPEEPPVPVQTNEAVPVQENAPAPVKDTPVQESLEFTADAPAPESGPSLEEMLRIASGSHLAAEDSIGEPTAVAGEHVIEPAPVPPPAAASMAIPAAPEPIYQTPVAAEPKLERRLELKFAPSDVRLPRFLDSEDEEDDAPGRRWLAIVAAVVVVVGASGAAYRTRDAWMPKVAALTQHSAAPRAAAPAPLVPPTVTLRSNDTDGQLQIRWDRDSAPVRDAESATLEIVDGAAPTVVQLDQAHLQSGTFAYARQSGRVDVKLTIHERDGRQVQQTTGFAGDMPKAAQPVAAAPPPPAPADGNVRKERDQLAKQVVTLKSQLAAATARYTKVLRLLDAERAQLRREQQRHRLQNQNPDR
ncbi:MAG TPA: hypothetical protein VG675_08595 [Bryobacteraceae bacterium]|nr:hypothetical protein [Bryobacteraceae bacterium]